MFWNASGLTERSNKSSSSSPTILPHQRVPAASEFQRGGQKRGGGASSPRWSLKNLHGSAVVGLVIIVVIGSICQLEHMVNPGQPSIFQISSLLAAYIRGANPVDLQDTLNDWLGKYVKRRRLAGFGDEEPLVTDPYTFFPWVKQLESNVDAVRDELIEYMRKDGKIPTRLEAAPNQEYIDEMGKWQMLWLYRCGGENKHVTEKFPVLGHLLRESPYALGDVGISVLPAQAGLKLHHGAFEGYERIHLPIVIPERGDARLYVFPQLDAENFDPFFQHMLANDPVEGLSPYVSSEQLSLQNITHSLKMYNKDPLIVDAHKPLDGSFVNHTYTYGKVTVFNDNNVHAVENASEQPGDDRIVVWIDIVKKFPVRLATLVKIMLAVCRMDESIIGCIEKSQSENCD